LNMKTSKSCDTKKIEEHKRNRVTKGTQRIKQNNKVMRDVLV